MALSFSMFGAVNLEAGSLDGDITDLNLGESIPLHKKFTSETANTDKNKKTNSTIESALKIINSTLIKVFGVGLFLFLAFLSFKFITAEGDEAEITKLKKQIKNAVIFFLATFAVDTFVRNVFYGTGKDIEAGEALKEGGAGNFIIEILGIIEYIKTFIAIIVFFVIVRAGFKILFAGDKEERLDEGKKSILWAVVGIIIILLSEFIIKGVNPNGEGSSELQNQIFGTIGYFLSFIGVLSTVFIAYGGFLMVTSQGEQEKFDKGKNIIINIFIGVILILVSYGLVYTIVGLKS